MKIIINAKNKSLGKLINCIIKIININNKTKIINYKYEIIIINMKYIKYKKKSERKIYYRHSGYPGGIKKTTLKDFFKKPIILIKKSIKGILPKNKLFKNLSKKIKYLKEKSNKFNIEKPKILINDELIL